MVVVQHQRRSRQGGRSHRYSNSRPARAFSPFKSGVYESTTSAVAEGEALASVLHPETTSDIVDALRWNVLLRNDVRVAIDTIRPLLPDADFLLVTSIDEIEPTFTLYVTSELDAAALLGKRSRVLDELWARPDRDITSDLHIAFRPR